jgi:hypothetical protein
MMTLSRRMLSMAAPASRRPHPNRPFVLLRRFAVCVSSRRDMNIHNSASKTAPPISHGQMFVFFCSMLISAMETSEANENSELVRGEMRVDVLAHTCSVVPDVDPTNRS